MKKQFMLACLFAITVTGIAQNNPAIKTTVSFVLSPEVKLVTDIYYPDTVNKYPVILVRSPYPRQQYVAVANFFVSKGYITVVQSVRGTGGSTGSNIPFVNETEDGIKVLDKIASKPWCNGAIGIFGASYNSFCGLTLGASGHPALKALVNISGWVEPSLMALPSGVNHLMLNIPWILFSFSGGKLVPGNYNSDSLFLHTPVNTVFKKMGINVELKQISSALQVNNAFDYKKFEIPVFHITGLYDFAKEGTFDLADSLAKYNKQQQMWVGPWMHDQLFSKSKKLGELELPAAAFENISQKVLDTAAYWFDKFLNKKEDLSNVDGFGYMPMFGESFSIAAKKYPGKHKTETYFISSVNEANSISGDGTLSKKSKAVKESDSFVNDPHDPVPTYGGANFHFFPAKNGPRDQSEIEKRKDVLIYSAAPAEKQRTFWGKMKVKLYASWSTADCDFTAKLVVVDPLGKAWIIADGIARMSLVEKKPTGNKDAAGNMIYEFTVDMGHTAFMLKEGWKLRLEIAGSNFPKYDRNPGNGDDPVLAEKFIPVKQNVFYGKKFPSALMIEY
jgi:uncharacterized protein